MLCHHPLSAFTLATGNKALRLEFQEKDVHGRLVRWIDLIADYRRSIIVRCSSNLPKDYLSQQSGNSKSESSLIIFSISDGDDIFEKELLALLDFLTSIETKGFDQRTLKWVKKSPKLCCM